MYKQCACIFGGKWAVKSSRYCVFQVALVSKKISEVINKKKIELIGISEALIISIYLKLRVGLVSSR